MKVWSLGDEAYCWCFTESGRREVWSTSVVGGGVTQVSARHITSDKWRAASETKQQRDNKQTVRWSKYRRESIIADYQLSQYLLSAVCATTIARDRLRDNALWWIYISRLFFTLSLPARVIKNTTRWCQRLIGLFLRCFIAICSILWTKRAGITILNSSFTDNTVKKGVTSLSVWQHFGFR